MFIPTWPYWRETEEKKREYFESRCADLCAEQRKLRRDLCDSINAAAPIMGDMRVDSIIADYIYVDSKVINLLKDFAYVENGPKFPGCRLVIGARYGDQYPVYDICEFFDRPFEDMYLSINDFISVLNGQNRIWWGGDDYRDHNYSNESRDEVIKYINLCMSQ